MQMGFMMICAGCVWMNKAQNTLLKRFLDACGTSLGFCMVVYTLVVGGTANRPATFIGLEKFFLVGVKNDSFSLFQLAFCATSVTIVGKEIICVAVLLLLLVGGGLVVTAA